MIAALNRSEQERRRAAVTARGLPAFLSVPAPAKADEPSPPIPEVECATANATGAGTDDGKGWLGEVEVGLTERGGSLGLPQEGRDANVSVGVTRPGEQRPTFPVVTITISGPPNAGKSVVAHLVRNALGREGLAVSGPEGLRSLFLRRALDNLLSRGLTVVLRGEEAAQ